MDNSSSFQDLCTYIDSQFDDVLAEESRVKRNPRFADNRVHALIYFITPTAHGLREPDVEFIRLMAPRVNVIPVIAKSDSLTSEELELNKRLIMQDIQHYQLCVYGFPGGDGFLYKSLERSSNNNGGENGSQDEDDAETSSIVDEEFNELNDYIRTKLPFAVIGASEVVEGVRDGDNNETKMQVRRYPWGVLDVNNPEYSDVELVRDIITRTHLHDLKETTHFVLYENYRTRKLSTGIGAGMSGLSSPMPESADSNSTKVASAGNDPQASLPSAFASGTNASLVSMASKDSTAGSSNTGLSSATNIQSTPGLAGINGAFPAPFHHQHNAAGSDAGSGMHPTSSLNSNSGLSASLLSREEQIRASEAKLRQTETQVQQEIYQKRQELLAREKELRELEAKLKAEAEALRSPNLESDYGFGNRSLVA